MIGVHSIGSYAKLLSVTIAISTVACLTILSSKSFADFTYGPGRIIDDTVFTDAQSMSEADIQNFLNSKVPSCDTDGSQPASDFGRPDLTHAQYASLMGWAAPPYTCLRDYIENGVSASQLIYNLSQQYQINPQVLIVTLQKESGLVTDSWPLSTEYKTATGYGCPDSGTNNSANCDSSYYGLTNQLTHTAYMYHAIMTQDPNWYSPYVVGDNYIQWNPNTSCGGTTVPIENWATAALYDYTPYQPNAAAWSAGWGMGDSCSAYGNRNFSLYFSAWFGSPVVIADFQVMKSSTSDTQYVVYNHMKQAIPSSDIKLAWGLDKMPLETIDQATIDSFSNGPDLDVVFRIDGGTRLYMADSGLKHYIPSSDLLTNWQLNNKVISNVTTDLGNLPINSSSLTYSAQSSSSSSIYMLDGIDGSGNSVLRNYPDADTFFAYEGPNPTVSIVSPWRFSTISNDIQTPLSSTKISYGGNEYQVVSGQKLVESAAEASLYPGTANAVSQSTFNRLVASLPITPFVRASNSPNVYLIQNGEKYYIPNSDMLNAWVGSGLYVNIVNPNFLDLIPDSGIAVSSSLAKATSSYIIQNGQKTLIDSSYTASYASPSPFTSSDQLMNVLPSSSNTIATRFVRDNKTNVIALLDDDAIIHPIPDIPTAQLWGVDKSQVTNLPDETFNSFTAGSALSAIVSDSSTTYAIMAGQRHTVSQASQWNLPSPVHLPDSTIASISLGSPLGLSSFDGSYYYRLIDGVAYATTDAKIASVWGISSSSPDYGIFIKKYYPNLGMLTPDIEYGGLYYVGNTDKLVSLSSPLYADLAWNYPTMNIDPSTIGLPIVSWTQPILQNSSGTWMVMDGGEVRPIENSTIQSFWTENYTQPSLVATDNLLGMFKTGPLMERAIKSNSSPKIYSAEAAIKRWITNPSTYQTMYAPYTIVTDLLLNAMPTGTDIN